MQKMVNLSVVKIEDCLQLLLSYEVQILDQVSREMLKYSLSL